jgi:hypothetical protein
LVGILRVRCLLIALFGLRISVDILRGGSIGELPVRA